MHRVEILGFYDHHVTRNQIIVSISAILRVEFYKGIERIERLIIRRYFSI